MTSQVLFCFPHVLYSEHVIMFIMTTTKFVKLGRAAYLMQTCHAIVIHQPRVGPVRQQEPCDFSVPTVAGPVQSCGAPMGLGITLSPAFQQELTYGIVPVAAGIVLQGRETKVRWQSPGRQGRWASESMGSGARGCQ